MEFLKQIGFSAIIKGFIIFSFYGIFTVGYIHFAHGLDAELPKGVMATLEGPISLYTFCWLALVGLILLLLVTKFGFSHIDIESRTPKLAFYLAIPICESAIALGVVIGATFLGIALGAHFLSAINCTDIILYPVFYTMAWAMFVVTYPVCMLVIYILVQKKTVRRNLNIATALYIFGVVLFLYIGLPWQSVVELGVMMAALIGVYLFFHWRLSNS